MSSFSFIIIKTGNIPTPLASGTLTVTDNGNNTATISITGSAGIKSVNFSSTIASVEGYQLISGVSKPDPSGVVSTFVASILCDDCDAQNIAGEISFTNNLGTHTGLLLGSGN